ncbi:MAG: PaaI family thioesterase [Candidatus Bathyarchaeia archaeon]
MEIKTHKLANPNLLGKPIKIVEGVEAIVELQASDEMAVDDYGLIHGGFTFGLADYAAMLAVNHPFVVLGAANIRFLAPVRVGEIMRAKALASQVEGRKIIVSVDVNVNDKHVLKAEMVCFILEKHVLSVL